MADVHPAGAGTVHDAFADFCALTLDNGAMHQGYFDGHDQPLSCTQATDRLIRTLGEHLKLTDASRLLDIGCGTAHPAILLAQDTGCAVEGVNVGRHQITTANRRVSDAGLSHRIRCHLANATALPFRSSAFSAALATEVLVHIENKPAALAEAFRCLKPTTRLVVSDFVLLCPRPQQTAALGIRFAPPSYPVSLMEMIRLVTQAGFSIRKVIDLTDHTSPTPTAMLAALKNRWDVLKHHIGPQALDEAASGLRLMERTRTWLGYAALIADKPGEPGNPR
ncbi:methyltransferase domain-containing protein [Streptomyces lavendofoliae]|uniref:methyltransferase domain-containing protein n=1 Tax=Streptomyces lavendofoliae TaxID=67314 RepID=UPI003D93322A